MELHMTTFLIVCPLVFLAGFVDAIGGGGGLISLPAYYLAGVPIHHAIATNKLSSATGTLISTIRIGKSVKIRWKLIAPAVVMALIGSYLGTRLSILTDEKILAYQKIFGNIIVDHTHAFFQKPLKGVDTLYSCRKFWGVSDGAYLSTDTSLTENKTVDYSAERMKHILGRYEHNAGTYYKDMLENAAKYDGMELRQMSKLTQNLLKAVDYDRAKKKREENYRILGELLPSESIFNQTVPEGPFAYPYFHADGMKLRRYLAEKKIFVPTYWKNIIENSETKSLEYTWAANILPLPCDQRYSVEDMKYMASVVRECEERI